MKKRNIILTILFISIIFSLISRTSEFYLAEEEKPVEWNSYNKEYLS